MSTFSADLPDPGSRPSAERRFGRFVLRRLLGRSRHGMLWLAEDARAGGEALLALPRAAPANAAALDAWLAQARHAARLAHPHLAVPSEIGTHEHWPYAACARALGRTLAAVLDAGPPVAPAEFARWLCQALEGLAFAHEAGLAHGDIEAHRLLVDERGHVRLAGLGTLGDASAADAGEGSAPSRGLSVDPSQLRAQRSAAERDVLAVGVLAQQVLGGTGHEGLDVARLVELLPPQGREALRLPWRTPQPVAAGLRAIVDRATHAQPRQRYLTARSLLRALDGWRLADATAHGGTIAQLLNRLATVGHLPALPAVAAAVARLSRSERQHASALAAQILPDLGLSLELLRQANAAQVQVAQAAGGGPVLTVRRAVAMLGLDGVRAAAAGLRAWPGPLGEADAAALQRAIGQARLAGLVAQRLRPAGYDAEVVFLLAVLQNLGRLLLHYHFPEDAQQIARLMRPAPAATGEAVPGLDEPVAACAVLGVDLEAMTAAVARHWGLDGEALHMLRRLPPDRPVRPAEGDGDLLRASASAANEAVDALVQLPPGRLAAALDLVARRYARVLGLGARELHDAVHAARAAAERGPTDAAERGPTDAADGAPTESFTDALPARTGT